jgi:hypothetical protein
MPAFFRNVRHSDKYLCIFYEKVLTLIKGRAKVKHVPGGRDFLPAPNRKFPAEGAGENSG